MLIDCDRCDVRGLACSDCVVSVLLGPSGQLDGEERHAIGVLADAGLVPPLRLAVAGEKSETIESPGRESVPDTMSRDLPKARSAG